jgi:5-(carboxyamino)imidazole ribonucleotide synthase
LSEPLDHVQRVGIVGAGQLARMLIEAAIPLGIPVTVLAERLDDGAALVSPSVLIGRPDDRDAMLALARATDVITFDHELVDVDILRELEARGHIVRPGSTVMALVQDKLAQRKRLGELDCPVPAWAPVGQASDVADFGETHGWPVIVKAVRGGYDGRGVWVVDGVDATRDLLAELGPDVPLLVERRVAIVREVAVQVARSPLGEVAVYPLIETVQVEGICRELRYPAPVPEAIAIEAVALAGRIAGAIGLVGLLAVELFVERDDVGNEHLIVNELAARPHNSAHWTIEGSVTSQFAQHLRAVLGWPLGATGAVAPAVASVNVLGAAGSAGDPSVRLPVALADPDVRVHLYGKVARPGRKIGHVTLTGADLDDVARRARRAAAILSGAATGDVIDG